jgi:hypothetical protein
MLSYAYITVLKATFIFCLTYILILLRYISAEYGHYQLCVSPVKIVSLYALFFVSHIYTRC